ncbi:MAG: hypothetical protein ABIV48_12075 [Pyrinomonadaceae bacterium]
MKSRAAELERVVLAPDDLDKAIAAQRSVSAIRILPRETYDNSFSSIRGGGCYYGFYFRTPDYGRGSELHWGDGYLKTGSTELALMADLGEIPIDQISRDTRIVVDFANYKVPSDLRNSAESVKARVGSLTIGETTSLPRVKPVVGHSYVVRSVHLGYYDILVAFTVFRRDADNSLILLWKLLQQNDTPREARDGNIAETDDQLHAKIQGWLGDKRFKGIVFKVSNRVVTLSGSADRQFFGYAIELANRSGASKIINLLEPR